MVYPSGQVWTESSIPAIENNKSSYVNVTNKNNLQIKDSLFDLMNFLLILKTIFEIENWPWKLKIHQFEVAFIFFL